MNRAGDTHLRIVRGDARRLTGASLVWDRPGAVLDVTCDDTVTPRVVDAWSTHIRALLDAVNWPDEGLATRSFAGGVSLAISAPMDALNAATDINEWALDAAVAELQGRALPSRAAATARLRALIEAEQCPALLNLRETARQHGVTCLSDDDHVSVGLGTGSQTWPTSVLPEPDAVDWSHVHDVPVALVTGTNGKSTTVRLLAAMMRAGGRVPGTTTTDDIRVGDDVIDTGDYAGPSGARTLLRQTRVEMAALETARGGLLRRGLALPRVAAAVVTNVGQDHLGEWGVVDFDALVDTKLILHRAVGPGGRLILNADDAALRRRGPELGVPLAWFSLEARNDKVQQAARSAGWAAFLEDDRLVLVTDGRRETITRIDGIPVALGGAARHNVANALAAILAGASLGLTPTEMADGLAAFQGTRSQNPGRGNLFELGGVHALVDFAHNTHGMHALSEMAAALPAQRRLLLIGQAGDRDDDAIRELTRVAWAAHPDRVIIKAMTEYLRGRDAGVIPQLIEDEFRRLGAAPESLEHAPTEMAAVRSALAWSRAGDLLLLISHTERTGVLDLLETLERDGWQPGTPLPG